MKILIAAAAIALVPTFATAGDMHAFDYRGNGNPIALADAPVIQTLVMAKAPVTPSQPVVGLLTRDSDYSIFVGAHVPAETQRQALRQLWKTNPELARASIDDSLAVSYPTQSASLAGSVVAALNE